MNTYVDTLSAALAEMFDERTELDREIGSLEKKPSVLEERLSVLDQKIENTEEEIEYAQSLEDADEIDHRDIKEALIFEKYGTYNPVRIADFWQRGNAYHATS